MSSLFEVGVSGRLIKAIIFDMDGVLIDAKEWHYEALNKALELFGYTINQHDHLSMFDGLPTRQKLEILSVERELPRGLHKFINEMKQIYTLEYIFTKCKPVSYHEYALSKLKFNGYLMAVASNSVRQTVDMMMDKSNLKKYLEFTLSNQDVSKSKPDPEIYNTAVNRFGLSPKECLIVEDNENGIAAAKASGAHLMVIKSVSDVNYENIMSHIKNIEENS
ncbi:MAG: HAD family phosphatase [Candidatus Gastranaerophilales bacterium]|nr:HAD family phosphatase [Candidatus Gastranaerophilales bacterium]